jgi:hypothetical protein
MLRLHQLNTLLVRLLSNQGCCLHVTVQLLQPSHKLCVLRGLLLLLLLLPASLPTVK